MTESKWGLFRIDDRLVHGQIVAIWCRHLPIKRIIVVDDEVAKNQFMRQVLQLSVPNGIKIDVLDVENSVSILNKISDKHHVIVLLKSPLTARRLKDNGLDYDELNIGGMGMAPGRKNVFKNISMNSEEIEILKALSSRGVKTTFLTIPGERSILLEEIEF